MTQNGKKRTGRKPNVWSVLQFKDISSFLSDTSTPVTQFVKTIGVSNQTFHNWKNNRCAPTEEVQRRIKNTIDGTQPGEKTDMENSDTATAPAKATKKATRRVLKKKPRGKDSVSLAALTDAVPSSETESAPTKKKRAGRKPGPRAVAKTAVEKVRPKAKIAKAKTNGTNGSSSPSDWAELSTLGSFLKANPGKSREELAGIIDVARELLV